MERRSPYIAGEVRVASKGGQKKIYGTAAVTLPNTRRGPG